jgi:uncharacterized protein (UPF0261 family)
MKTIVLIGTMDTKSELFLFVRGMIEEAGHKALLIDIGTRDPSPVAADVTCDEIARLGETSIEQVRGMKQGKTIISSMTEGATRKVKELHREGKLDGLFSLGGAGTTTIATAVMRSLPFGIPKLMVSSAAGIPAYAASFLGTGDIMIMNTIVDLAGLNEMVKSVLSRGAAAICSMVETIRSTSLSDLLSSKGKPLIALTEDGSCERCGAYARRVLQARGYEVITFHAQGLGDRAMENLINKGFFDGVLDIAVIGVSDELWEGNRPGGPDRLEMAGRRGIPLVLTPCGLNHTGAGPTRRHSEKYATRSRIYRIDDLRVATRYNEEELAINGRTVAKKLNMAKGPVRVYIPLRGFSAWDPPGTILYAPEEDMILVNELKRCLKPGIEVVEIDANLEDESFARALVDGFDELFKRHAHACDKGPRLAEPYQGPSR